MYKCNKILFLLFLFLLNSCTKYITKQEAYPEMYNERPMSILVLPPINITSAADAGEYYCTTIAEPLSFSGFYVYPLEVITDIFKYEGLYESGNLENIDPAKFQEYFGADAVLYIRILEWDTSYIVIGGSVTVAMVYKLISTKTREVLWRYSERKVIDTSGDSGGAGGIAGCLVIIVTTAIKTAATDYVPIAKQANYQALTTIPFGNYHPQYGTDQNNKVVVFDRIGTELEKKYNVEQVNKPGNTTSKRELTESDNIKCFNTGSRLYKEKNYKRAIELWKKIPANSKYFQKAQTYIGHAEKKIDKGENLSEKDYLQYCNEGVKLYKAGEYQKALEIWEKVPITSKYYNKIAKYKKQTDAKINK